MWPAIKLSMESLACLIDIERSGIQIDQQALNEVETLFKTEKNALEIKMGEMVRLIMGDTPINTSSPEHMSWVVYSRKVKDKHLWA
jgi:DNA polymerase I-like protein with 3'-5' exonuclease and polymerase domains